jgi:hypothetical protein
VSNDPGRDHDPGKGYVKYIAAVAGAAIGWALGETIARGMTAPVGSFWARGELAGSLLQYGGAAIGALVLFLVFKKLLG